jgi:hypothetical protein
MMIFLSGWIVINVKLFAVYLILTDVTRWGRGIVVDDKAGGGAV